MIRNPRAVAVLSLAIALGLVPGRLAGQRAEQASLGFAVGIGWVPSAHDTHCGHPLDQAVRGIMAEGRLAFPLGHGFSLEGRLSAQSKVDLQNCAGGLLAAADTFYITEEYHLQGDGFAGGDVRLRYDLPGVPLVVSVGAGELWKLKAPYLVFGPGLRLGRRVRLILDGDLIYANVPFDEVWRGWSGGVPGDVFVRAPRHELRALGGGRAGIELRLR